MQPSAAALEVLDSGYQHPLVGGTRIDEPADARGLEIELRDSEPTPRARAVFPAAEHLLPGGSRKQLLCSVRNNYKYSTRTHSRLTLTYAGTPRDSRKSCKPQYFHRAKVEPAIPRDPPARSDEAIYRA